MILSSEGRSGYVSIIIVIHSRASGNRRISDTLTPSGEWLGLRDYEGRGKLR